MFYLSEHFAGKFEVGLFLFVVSCLSCPLRLFPVAFVVSCIAATFSKFKATDVGFVLYYAGKTEKTEHVEKNLNPQWDKARFRRDDVLRGRASNSYVIVAIRVRCQCASSGRCQTSRSGI